MGNVSVIEEKIKKLKKTIAEKSSGSEDQSGGGEARVFRKNLKRLQRRRRVILTTHVKDKKAEAPEEIPKVETRKAEAAPAGEKTAEKTSEPKEQKSKPSGEKPKAQEKTEAKAPETKQPESSSQPEASSPEGSSNNKKPEPPAA